MASGGSVGTSGGAPTLTFDAGVTSLNLAVSALADNLVEGTEGVRLGVAGGAVSGSGGSTADVRIIDDPAVAVPVPQTLDENTTLVFSQFYNNSITVTQPDGGVIELTVTATNGLVSTADAQEYTQSVTLTGTAAEVNAALSGLVYAPDTAYYGPATLTISATDYSGPPTTATVPITVRGVTEAPYHLIPTIQHTLANTPLVFSSAAGNEIVVVDEYVESNPVQVTLTATNGTLTLGTTADLTFTAGDGTADPTMTFSGGVAAINAALDGLIFTPATGFTGTSGLTITTDDLGNTGSGIPMTGTDTVQIAVQAVGDAPGDTLSDALVVVGPGNPGLQYNELIGDGANGTLDVDLYEVQLSAGQQLALRLTGQDGFVGVLRLFDGAGAELGFEGSGDYVTAPSTGTYYVGVSGLGNTDYDPLTAASGTPAWVGFYALLLEMDVDPPVAHADSAATTQNTPVTLDVLANDTHAPGETLTLAAVSNGPHGMVALNSDGTVTYTPFADWAGTDNFEYTVQDGRGWKATGTAEVTVTVVNAGPAAVSVSAMINGVEGTQYTGATFEFFRTSGDLSQPLTVTITVGGTATEGTDYTPLARQVTFDAGEESAYLTVNATDDGLTEGDEVVVVTLVSGTGYNVVADYSAATVAISDPVNATDPGVFTFNTVDDQTASGSFGLPQSAVIDPNLADQDVALTAFTFTLAGRTFTLSETENGAVAHLSYGLFDGISFVINAGGGNYPYASITADHREVTVIDTATGTPSVVFAFYAQDPQPGTEPKTTVNGKALTKNAIEVFIGENRKLLPSNKDLNKLSDLGTAKLPLAGLNLPADKTKWAAVFEN